MVNLGSDNLQYLILDGNEMFKNFLGIYDEKRLKSHMKMALQRIKMESNKATNMTKHNKKEIAQLLKDGKIELARIKCEHIVRTDDMIEAYGIIELYLELLYARVHYISTSTTGVAPPPDLREPVASVIFASGKVKIDELGVVAQQLGFKFGTEWKNDAERSHGTAISNERILRKLSMIPVSATLGECIYDRDSVSLRC